MDIYNPYPYNPRLRSFFNGDGSGAPGPDAVKQAIAANPVQAPHIQSVWSFLGWLQQSNPTLYNLISNQRPDLVDPVGVVASGALAPTGVTAKVAGTAAAPIPPRPMSPGLFSGATLRTTGNLRGLADIASDGIQPAIPAATSWGQDLIALAQQAIPAIFQAKTANALLGVNVQRAEQGLPPLDSSSLAAGVNVGLSPGVTQIAYIAVGGLLLVGLAAAFKKAR